MDYYDHPAHRIHKIDEKDLQHVSVVKIVGQIGDEKNQIFEFAHPAAPFVAVDLYDTLSGHEIIALQNVSVQRYTGGVRVITKNILPRAAYTIVILG